MKKCILTFFLILSLFYPTQSLVIYYNLTFNSKKESDTLKNQNFSLIIDLKNQISLFSNVNSDIFDDDIYFSILKKYNSNNYIQYERILDDIFEYEYISKFNWIIINKTFSISGYTVKTAHCDFGGRKWTAYFTEDIPISDGPYKFEGLPGLILELKSDDNDYHFKLVGIQKNNLKNYLLPKSIKISKTKLSNYKKIVLKNPSLQYKSKLEIAKNKGYSFVVTYDGINSTEKQILDNFNYKYKEWLVEHNNPIEKNTIWLK